MGKMILFAGKELPAGNDVVSGASFQGRSVIATSLHVDESEERSSSEKTSGVIPVVWNRGSPLSARSIALKCENSGGIDEAALIFDEFYYATKYRGINNAQTLEELIGSYQYLTQELLARFARNSEKVTKLAFIHKANFTLADGVNSSSLRSSGVELSNPLIAAASAAFRAFAENTAATLAEGNSVIPVLVSCEPNNDLSKRDSSLSVWLCEYLDAIDNLKKPLSPKQKVSWIKAGAKAPSGLGILGF
ncbi:MAG: hypothetical protein IJ257_04810 [Treponema sp.]|nr:hypothetical protein [Treponema sp.]